MIGRPGHRDVHPSESEVSSFGSESVGDGRWPVRLALAQGVFFFVTGVWPLLHLGSFLAVTGPKTDLWLVQTVGALLAVFGAVLVRVARRGHLTPEWRLLAAGFAATLAIVDAVFVFKGVIPPIYLADAAVELLIVAAWIATAVASHESSAR